MADVSFSVGIEQSDLAYLKILESALNNFRNATALVTKVVQTQNKETGDLSETYTVQLNILEEIKGKMIAVNKEYQATIKLNQELMEGEIKKQRLINKGITPTEIEKERKINSVRRERNKEAAKISGELKLHDPIFDILADPNNQKLSAQMSLQISRLSKEFVNANITAEQFKDIVYDIINLGPDAFDKLPDQFKAIGERALSVYRKIEDTKRNVEVQKESSTMLEWLKKKHKIIDAYNSASSNKEKENLNLLLTKMSAVYKLSGLTKDNFYKLFSETFKNGSAKLDELNEKEKQVARYALEVRNKTDNIVSKRERKDDSKELAKSLITKSAVFKIGMTEEEIKTFDRVIIKSRKFYENTTMTKEQFKSLFNNVLVHGLRDFNTMTEEQRATANHFLKLHDMLYKSGGRALRSRESKELTRSLIAESDKFKIGMKDSEIEKFNRIIIASRKFYENTTMTKQQFSLLFNNVLVHGLRDFNTMTDEQRNAANHFLKLHDMIYKSGEKALRSRESKELTRSLIDNSARFKTGMTNDEITKFNRIVIASRKFYENTTMTKEQFTLLFKDVLINGMKNFSQLTDEQRNAANHFLKLHDMLYKTRTRSQRRKEGKEFVESIMTESNKFKIGMTDSEVEKFNKIVIGSKKFYENSTLTKEQFTILFKNVLFRGLKDFSKMTEEQRVAANHFLKLREMLFKTGLRTQRSQESKELAKSLIIGTGKFKTGMTNDEITKFNRIVIASRKFYENTTMTKEQFTLLFKDVLINGMKNFSQLTDEQRNAANHFLKLHDMLYKTRTRSKRNKESKEIAEFLIADDAKLKTGMSNAEIKQFDRVVIASRKFYENTTMAKEQFISLFQNVLVNGLRDFSQMTNEQRAAANHFLKFHDLINKSKIENRRSRESKELAQSLIKESNIYKTGMTEEEVKRFNRVVIASRKFYENSTLTKEQFKILFETVLIDGLRNFSKMTDEERAAANHFLKLHDMLYKSGQKNQRSRELSGRMSTLTYDLTDIKQISKIQSLFKTIDNSIKSGKYSLREFMAEFSRLKGPESSVKILSKATNDLQVDIGRLKLAMEGGSGGRGGQSKGSGAGASGDSGGPLSVLGELMTPKGLLGVFRLQLVHRLFSSLINAIANGAKQAAALDAKLIRIKTITQEINISDYEWKTRLLDISKQTGTESIETLDAAYKLFSNNIGKSVKSLKALQEALIFGKISNSTAQASVDLLSFTLNAFKINVSESERVLGVLFKTIDLGNITAEEMANTLGMTAPLAKQLGVSLEEFNTAAVVITQQGVNFETASTLIRNVIKEMINPTDAMKTLFQEWGVSSGEAAIKTYGLYGVLLKLRQEIDKGGTTRLGELIEDMRSLVAVPALAGKGNLELFKSTQLAMASASDTYTRAKDLVSESSSTIMDKVLNKISTSFIQIGSVIYDTMADLFRSDFGQGLVKVFEKLLKQIELITLAVEALILTTLEAFDNLPEDIKKQFNLDFGNKFFEVTEKGLKNYIKTVRDNMAEERKRSTIVLENLDNEIEKTRELIKEKERVINMPNADQMLLSSNPMTAMENAVKSFAAVLQTLGLDFSEYFDAGTNKEKQKLEELLASKEAFGKIDELRLKISEIEDKNLQLAETTKNRTKGILGNIKMLFQEEGVEIDKILEKQKEKFKKISEDVTKKKEELKNKFIEEEITKRLDVDGGIFAKLKKVGGVVFALKQQARDFFNIRNIDEARNKFDTIRNILTDINKDLRSGIKKSMEEITRIQIEMEDEAFKRSIEKKSKGTKDRMIKNRIQEIMAQAAQTIDIEESRRLFQKAAGLAGDLQQDPKGQTIRQIREMQIQKEQQFIEFARNAMLDEAALLQDRLNLEDNILAQETNINAQIERSLEIYKNIYAEQEKTLNLRKEELDVLNQQLQAILDAEGRKRTQVLPQEASTPAFATGGRLGIDNLIARVSPGEMIMSTAATNNWRPVLTAMNAGMFNNGGSTTTVGDINITMNQSGSAQTDVRELAGLLRRELRRGTIRLA